MTTSPIGAIVAGAHRAAADITTERMTDPLTGRRSPLGYTDEAEPFFAETLNAREYPWFATGAPFPFKSTPDAPVPDDAVPGEVVRADDAPATVALRVIREGAA